VNLRSGLAGNQPLLFTMHADFIQSNSIYLFVQRKEWIQGMAFTEFDQIYTVKKKATT